MPKRPRRATKTATKPTSPPREEPAKRLVEYSPNTFCRVFSLTSEDEQTKMLDRLVRDISVIPTLNTRVSYLTSFRKAARKHLSAQAPQIVEKLKLPQSLWSQRKTEKSKKLKEKQHGVITIKDPQTLLNTAATLLKSEKKASRGLFRDLLVALALFTGRRFIELAKCGHIYDDSSCGPHEIWFTGQAKAKRQVAPYKIPILGDKQQILNAWTQLRQLKPKWKTMDNDAITRSTNKSINQEAREAFPEIISSFKDLRALYAAICWDRFAKNGSMTVSAYASSILGHWEDDNIVGLHYGNFKVWQPETSLAAPSS